MRKNDIKSMHLEEIQAEFIEMGLPKFRAAQVYKWLHQGVATFDEMTDLSKQLRQTLDEKFFIPNCEIKTKRVSKIDGTVKYLFKLFDGNLIEAVIMRYKHGISICISSQVGCKMGCTFCATGKMGFTRDLLPSEMLSQVLTAQNDIGERISNIVLMGMGEPLDNYDNVLKFLKLVSSDTGLNIGMRHISLSTCGLVDKIEKLQKEKLQLTLSVSLHASDNKTRSEMMPINKSYNIDKLLTACKHYVEHTGRRISFEYAMIDGINDSKKQAHELAIKLKGILCHINLIPVNSVTGTSFSKSKMQALKTFVSVLESRGFTATIRRTLGSDINASCGQLKAEDGN